jgi:trans-aconitate methyltransferase
MAERQESWDAKLYQSSHSFVWKLGRDLVALLNPQPGERILDIGCGTGQLTAQIAQSGAVVVGVDSAASMVDQARHNFPGMSFAQMDATALTYNAEFDAVFSNATLHWVRDAGSAAQGIQRSLKPGGRVVVEFGGRGNTAALLAAIYKELAAFGIRNPESLSRWYYPSIGGYTSLLERHGLEVTFATLFDRPTPLEGEDGLRKWLRMFGGSFTGALAADQRGQFIERVEQRAASTLRPQGVWTIDYRRIRVEARKPPDRS